MTKSALGITILAFLFSGLLNAQSVSLLKIFLKSKPDVSAAVVDADSKGGVMRFTRDYSSSCKTNYVLKWEFSKDLSTLNEGDEFEVTLTCLSCKSTCGKKWTSGSVSGSGNIFWPITPEYPSEYNGNIDAVVKGGGVNGWDQGSYSTTSTLKYSVKKNVPHTAFYIMMGDHYVYYIYGQSAAPSGPVNCHTLLGLGKNMFSLEYGALDNKDISTWMIPTIDNAINHVNATNCLSPAYLIDLRKRMVDADSSLPFYSEIQEYSAGLDEEILTSCPCCASCEN